MSNRTLYGCIGSVMLFVVLAAWALSAALQRSTGGGDCIGITDDGRAGVKYAVSKRNVILGVVFSETLIIPAYVVLYRFKCPV